MSSEQVRIFNAVIQEDHKTLSGLPVGDVRPPVSIKRAYSLLPRHSYSWVI